MHPFSKQVASCHIVAQLLDDLPKEVKVEQDLIEKGHVLDNFYIPARYPNGHPSGSPFEHYGKLQSNRAIEYASEIVEFVRLKMA